MDAFVVVSPSRSTSKCSQPKSLSGNKARKKKRSLATNTQCDSESPTKGSDRRGAADTLIPRKWIDGPSEAATQQLMDIVSVQDDNVGSAQILGPQVPPSQPPFPPCRSSPSNMMQELLEEPNRSQPFNNIEAILGPVTNDRQSSRDVEDEEYTVEGWSVAYYVREDSPGHMTKTN